MASATQIVEVNLAERSYGIEIGSGNLGELGRLVAQIGKFSHAVIITDTNVESPYAERAAECLAVRAAVDLLVVEAGEPTKSTESADWLWRKLLEINTDRRSLVVAVGGGVVGDLAGFVAATFARGLAFVQVPTTLLAQVDSSVGGKVGVNLPDAKNMVGAFWQPAAVLIDTQSLDSLSDREYRSGLAEVIKYGVILDADFFAFLERNTAALRDRDHKTLVEVIARCCRLKAQVVVADEREETGRRAVLNYGHTFGHAIEAVAGYGAWLHGEAVAVGMMCAARLARRLGRVDAAFVARQQELLRAVGLPLSIARLEPDLLLGAMRRDKKVEHGRLRLVLPTGLGRVELVDGVPDEAVAAAWVE